VTAVRHARIISKAHPVLRADIPVVREVVVVLVAAAEAAVGVEEDKFFF
jgi:hypothetical protein